MIVTLPSVAPLKSMRAVGEYAPAASEIVSVLNVPVSALTFPTAVASVHEFAADEQSAVPVPFGLAKYVLLAAPANDGMTSASANVDAVAPTIAQSREAVLSFLISRFPPMCMGLTVEDTGPRRFKITRRAGAGARPPVPA